MTERWLPVRGWEGIYRVSNLGRVERIKRHANGRRLDGPTFGSLLRSNGGDGKVYRIMRLFDTASGRPPESHLVHRLVADAFVEGRSESRCWVNHRDGDGLNNRDTNIEWCTPGWNAAHGYRELGRKKLYGATNGRAKLDTGKVAEIRRRGAAGELHRIIAADFGISRTMVSFIVKGKSWPLASSVEPIARRSYSEQRGAA